MTATFPFSPAGTASQGGWSSKSREKSAWNLSKSTQKDLQKFVGLNREMLDPTLPTRKTTQKKWNISTTKIFWLDTREVREILFDIFSRSFRETDCEMLFVLAGDEAQWRMLLTWMSGTEIMVENNTHDRNWSLSLCGLFLRWLSVQMFSVTLAVFSSIFGRLCQSDRMNDSSSGKCFSGYLKGKTTIILRFWAMGR